LTKIDTVNNKCIVNGKRDAETLAVVLDSFIQRYVLCQKCRNPETVLNVKGEIITSQCKACGKTNQIDMSHRLSTYILKNPPEKEVREAGGYVSFFLHPCSLFLALLLLRARKPRPLPARKKRNWSLTETLSSGP
jgi:hypothetical protein